MTRPMTVTLTTHTGPGGIRSVEPRSGQAEEGADGGGGHADHGRGGHAEQEGVHRVVDGDQAAAADLLQLEEDRQAGLHRGGRADERPAQGGQDVPHQEPEEDVAGPGAVQHEQRTDDELGPGDVLAGHQAEEALEPLDLVGRDRLPLELVDRGRGTPRWASFVDVIGLRSAGRPPMRTEAGTERPRPANGRIRTRSPAAAAPRDPGLQCRRLTATAETAGSPRLTRALAREHRHRRPGRAAVRLRHRRHLRDDRRPSSRSST